MRIKKFIKIFDKSIKIMELKIDLESKLDTSYFKDHLLNVKYFCNNQLDFDSMNSDVVIEIKSNRYATNEIDILIHVDLNNIDIDVRKLNPYSYSQMCVIQKFINDLSEFMQKYKPKNEKPINLKK